MRAKDNRIACLKFIQTFMAWHTFLRQVCNKLRIMDQRPERDARQLLSCALKRLVHRAPDAEAEACVFTDCQIHLHTPSQPPLTR